MRRIGNLRFWMLLSVLLVSGVVINAWERIGEAHVERASLGQLPAQIGDWQKIGVDERFDKDVEQVLGASDYVMRSYALNGDQPASLYVGYYQTQRVGATYHSPLNCLPGSGWELADPKIVRITPVDGSPAFDVNHYIIQRGSSDRQLLLYWYAGRGRATASEYRDKVNTVIDSITRRRSDGAMVRILMPIGAQEAETLAAAKNLAAEVAPVLPQFVPN